MTDRKADGEEMGNRVGFLGPKGTFTEYATVQLMRDREHVPFPTIPECLDAVAEGSVDYAVVPLENAIEGSVNLTIDYLIHEQPLPIVGEVIVPITQHLMVHPQNEGKWDKISDVYSHSHAIAQCHQFFHRNMPVVNLHYMNSTGLAAAFVKEHPDRCIAAVGNEFAAKEYGLEVVKRNIHDFNNNHTRFMVVARKDTEIASTAVKPSYKTTLMVTLGDDYSGALHQVLSAFSWRKLNLSKIESRPTKTGLGNYFFIIDVEMKLDGVLIPGVKAELEALGCRVTILGSYPSYFFR
ncbi:prephenate dehydratase [Bacillus marinisedimentorum]|uniref:prephenate dehydratase n=1 Tax=Bacillus marinisedimentorum TaxID=1821260 RepID=UPI001FDEC963|nr:prephenate dehydratase [Bacillus marinisedimentorum]